MFIQVTVKISEIIPVFEEDSKLELTNYRPISSISNLAKVLEKNNA